MTNSNLSADQFDYIPVEWSRVDFARGPAPGQVTAINPKHAAGADPIHGGYVVNKAVEARSPEGDVVGKATWSSWPKGNISVEVDEPYRRHGVGWRLTEEAYQQDPESWENPYGVTWAGRSLVEKMEARKQER